MIKVSVQSLKGGTAKTSTSVNLGHALAMAGKKVLIIDTDTQGHIATHLGLKSQTSIYDLMAMDIIAEECIVNARENLDCILSGKATAALEQVLVAMPRREEVLKLKTKRLTGYDYVLVDCSPSLSLMHQNALLFSDHLLIPVSMDTLALAGAATIMESGKLLCNHFETPLSILGFLPTFYDARTNISKEVHDYLLKYYGAISPIFKPIRTDTRLKEAAAKRKTIFEYDPKSRGAEDYHTLAVEIMARTESMNGKS